MLEGSSQEPGALQGEGDPKAWSGRQLKLASDTFGGAEAGARGVVTLISFLRCRNRGSRRVNMFSRLEVRKLESCGLKSSPQTCHLGPEQRPWGRKKRERQGCTVACKRPLAHSAGTRTHPYQSPSTG